MKLGINDMRTGEFGVTEQVLNIFINYAN